MRFGVFNIPFALGYPSGRETAKDVIDWDIRATVWADEYGLDEAYFAEHYTLGFEPSPAPDLMIAAASQVTSRITLGAAGHLLPYHNPIALAHRMLWLDHMTGGRYIAGVAPGAYPSDAKLFGTGKNNPAMMIEALDVIEAVWTKEGPHRYEGEYYSVDIPEYDATIAGPHMRSRQSRIPILMTGMQPTSPTLIEAGRRGFLPMSQSVSTHVWRRHWETYAESARTAGHTPSRRDWRVVRNIIVADTDAEAREQALNGPSGQVSREHNLPNFIRLGLGPLLTEPEDGDVELTPEWLVDNNAIVGSPETVAAKLRKLYERTGGFGTMVTPIHDYKHDPEPQRRSLELLGQVVAPMLRDLEPED
ncbi:LLM class flavin-dependent oxidoreductase [Pseudonocardia alni]|uniref:LLM class flavin-dependent oxidoreductase n=1 Tax=Pseudonocardia alni TaxID=33907 RepID=UPI0033CB9BAF